MREEERKEWVENLGQAMTVVYTSSHVRMRRVGLLHLEVERHNEPEAKPIPNESRTIVVFHQ